MGRRNKTTELPKEADETREKMILPYVVSIN